MNKNKIYLGIMIQVFVFLFLIQNISGSVLSYTGFPATDGLDDVYYNSTGDTEEFDGSGDYFDCIDIVKVNITGGSIIVEFSSAGVRSGNNYTFQGFIDVDNDNHYDYHIAYGITAGGYLLQNLKSGHQHYGYIWDGSYWWSSFATNFPVSDTGKILNLSTICTAFDEDGFSLSSSSFHIFVGYTSSSAYAYLDFLPEQGMNIPGFHWIFVLAAIITLALIGII
ncbi:MAG: hypothetical protein GF329_06680, partial [Candidatus Lokiarchaeota archaeon]|nr:hypothetical protein [Candidatus Lokiarchaeota archaeon]